VRVSPDISAEPVPHQLKGTNGTIYRSCQHQRYQAMCIVLT